MGVSTLGVNFPTEDEWRFLGEQGLLLRAEPAVPLAERRLRQLRRLPRRPVLRPAQDHPPRAPRRRRRSRDRGPDRRDLTEEHWDAFFAFYMDTGSRKWGRPYLNRRFFSLLGERMADRVLLIMARRGGRWIAGALNLIGGDCLYGRNWGCVEDVPFLHFELCYYQAIEWAIDPWPGPGRGGRAGPAQDRPRLSADGRLFGPLHRRPRLSRAGRAVPGGGTAAVQGEMDWLAEEYSPFAVWMASGNARACASTASKIARDEGSVHRASMRVRGSLQAMLAPNASART
jgi:hypothetical protein